MERKVWGEEARRNLDLLERRGFGRRRTQSWLTKATTGGRCGARGGQRGRLRFLFVQRNFCRTFRANLAVGDLGVHSGSPRLMQKDGASRFCSDSPLGPKNFQASRPWFPARSLPLMHHVAIQTLPILTRLFTSTVVLFSSQHISGCCCSCRRVEATHPTPRRFVWQPNVSILLKGIGQARQQVS